MIIGYNGITTKYASLDEDIAESARSGFAAIEIRDYKLVDFFRKNNPASLRRILERHCLTPVALNSLEIVDGVYADVVQYAALKEKLVWLARTAADIGCPYLVTAPLINTSQRSKETIDRELVALYQELSDLARPYDTKIGFEFIGLPGAMTPTLHAALALIRDIDRDNVGLVLDTFAFYANRSDIRDISAIPVGKLYLVHLDDSDTELSDEPLQESNRVFPGEGVIPFGRIIPELVKIGYDGAYSVELFNPKIWCWDVRKAVAHAFQTAKNVVGQYYD
jgi:2-keto-myo-inositol isomerase